MRLKVYVSGGEARESVYDSQLGRLTKKAIAALFSGNKNFTLQAHPNRSTNLIIIPDSARGASAMTLKKASSHILIVRWSDFKRELNRFERGRIF